MIGSPLMEPTKPDEGKALPPQEPVPLKNTVKDQEALPGYAVEALTKGFGATLRRRVEKMDADGDGTLDINELKATLKEDYRNYKANKQMKVILIFMFVTLLMSVGATCGTTYAMVAFLKDAEVSNDGLLKATKHSGPVRTASARGSIHAYDGRENEVAAHVRLRHLQQSGNETNDQQEICLNDCPVGEASCTQARKWFTMLQEETTVTDVTFQVTTRQTNTLNVRAQAWSSIPATILGHDTDEAWGDSPPSYFVACPSVFYLEPEKECTCRISMRDAVPVRRPNTAVTVDEQDSSSTRNSTARRALASVLHPDNDHFMAAAVGDMVVAPLGQLPCEEVARLQASMQKAGRRAHFTYTLPSTKVHIPISAELKAVHITSESETTEAELVLSVDLKLSALHTGIGHAKFVCPHANLSTITLAKTAALDPDCSCGIFGTHGLALQHHKNLLAYENSQGKGAIVAAEARSQDQVSTSSDDGPAADPAIFKEDSAAVTNNSPFHRSQGLGGRKMLLITQFHIELFLQVHPARFPDVFHKYVGWHAQWRVNEQINERVIVGAAFNDRYSMEVASSFYCQFDPTREEDPAMASRPPGCYGNVPPRPVTDHVQHCWTPSELELHHVGPRGLRDQRDVRLDQWAYYVAPTLTKAEALPSRIYSDRRLIVHCGRPFETAGEAGPFGPYGVKDGIQADSSTGILGETIEKFWNPVYIGHGGWFASLCWHGEDGQAPTMDMINQRLQAGDADWFNSLPVKCAMQGVWEAQVVREEFVVEMFGMVFRHPSGPCFPASSRVWRLDRGHSGLPPSHVRMDELRLGDIILTLDKKGHAAWSPVLFMGHASRERTTEFVELHGRTGRVLHASPEHLLMLAHSPEWSSAQALPAQAAQPGMYVFSVPVPNGLRGEEGVAVVPEQIMKVTRLVDKGLFAPHTTSPDAILVVDGFAAHELTTNYSMRQLSFLKWLLSGLHKLLGAQRFGAIHDWLHAQHFPELVNHVVALLRYCLHPLGIKG